MMRITRYLTENMLRSRFALAYGLVLLAICSGLFLLSNDPDKAVIGIHNVLLILVPVVVMIFTVSQLYNSTDFIRLLLTQPVKRKSIFFSQYLSVTLMLALIQLVAVAASFLLFADTALLLQVLINVMFLTVVFSSISHLIAFKVNEKVKGMGITILLGIYFLAVYDGLVLLIINAMRDYPIEKYGIALSLLNPIDLCRILFIFQMDISALMGLTGALMEKFIGSALGSLIIYIVLLLWAMVPMVFALRFFNRKDY